MKLQLFNEIREVKLNPVTISRMENGDAIVNRLAEIARESEVILLDYVDEKGKRKKLEVAKIPIKTVLETIRLMCVLLGFKIAENENLFLDRVQEICPSLQSLEATSGIVMMYYSSFKFQCGLYDKVFEVLANETLSLNNACELLLKPAREVEEIAKKNKKPASVFPRKRREV